MRGLLKRRQKFSSLALIRTLGLMPISVQNRTPLSGSSATDVGASMSRSCRVRRYLPSSVATIKRPLGARFSKDS